MEQILQKVEAKKRSTDELRQARTVEILERIGNKEAQALLETLAKGSKGAALTKDAKRSLARLRKK